MGGIILPIELILGIYDYCDKETRININRAFKWSYKNTNPFKDYQFGTLRFYKLFYLNRFSPHYAHVIFPMIATDYNEIIYTYLTLEHIVYGR
jgi:hypothetical protein